MSRASNDRKPMSSTGRALVIPEEEVVAKASRRRFTQEYQRKIVARAGEVDLADVHHGQAEPRVTARAAVLATAHLAHPERFPAGPPQPLARPAEVWINPPKTRATEEALLH
jgi:hypothetical protein